MLRLLVVLLLLANGVYFVWSHGHLAALGLGPVNPSEPQRLAQQVKPEALKVLSAEEARRQQTAADAPAAPLPTECLMAGPFDDKVSVAVKAAATQSLAESHWKLEPATVTGRWIVYMGRYADADTLNRKKAELRARRVPFEPLQNPALEPGLSLGGFATQAAANEELNNLAQHGVRTARVVQESPDAKGWTLRLPAVDESLKLRLGPIRESLGRLSLHACNA